MFYGSCLDTIFLASSVHYTNWVTAAHIITYTDINTGSFNTNFLSLNEFYPRQVNLFQLTKMKSTAENFNGKSLKPE
jgi:hypothetical protein